MRLAVFDIDGTLVAGPSTEKRFALHLARQGLIGPRQVLAFVAFLLRELPHHGRHVLKKDKAYLAGLREQQVRDLAAGWAGPALADAWFEPCLARLRRHLQAGDVVVLLSGTPQFVAAAIGTALGVDQVIGTNCAIGAGCFLPRPPLTHPFGADKLGMVRDLARAHGIDLRDVTAYADSAHDLPLCLAVGEAIAVRPDRQLAAVARARGWEVLGKARMSQFPGRTRSDSSVVKSGVVSLRMSSKTPNRRL